MVPTASTQRLTLLMHTCKIRTEDFLDVATSARLSSVVPDEFPRTSTSYWLLLLWSLLLRVWIDWEQQRSTGLHSTRVSMLPDYYVALLCIHV